MFITRYAGRPPQGLFPKRRDAPGFTLVELIVVLGLLGVVFGSLTLTLVSGQRTQRYTSDRAVILDATRASMARMTKDIRQASAVDPTSDGNHLAIQTYVKGIPATITYDIVGTKLLRTVAGHASETMQTQLATTSIFAYSPDVASAEIITILIEVKPAAAPDTIVRLTSEVHLRNRLAS